MVDFLFKMAVSENRGFGETYLKIIYYSMSKNHTSVSPQFLTNYLAILDIKKYSHYKFTIRKVVSEHYNFIFGLWTISTVLPLLMFGHVTYQGFH